MELSNVSPSSAVLALNPRRILVRGVNWLGDAVMSTPALLRLRERFPEAHIALLTHQKLAELWLHHQAVNQVVTFAGGEGVLAIGRRLRESNFDLALVLPNSPRSALEVWAAHIPCRVGYRRSWRNWFLTDCVEDRSGAIAMRKHTPSEVRQWVAASGKTFLRSPIVNPLAHHIHQYLHLVGVLGGNAADLPPNLCVTEAEVAEAAKKFELRPNAVWLALNPGAEYGPAKRWPAERFIAAAREVQSRAKCRWLVLGGKGDKEMAGGIADALDGAVNLAGRTSLRDLCAVLKLSRVLLTNDTGPMHVGAALGTPVVALFGSTSPELTGPISSSDVQHRLVRGAAPCAPCFLRECPIDFRCMHGITPEHVAGEIMSALAGSGQTTTPPLNCSS